MKRVVAFATALLFAVLFCSSARADLAVGDVAPPVIAIAGKQVPLPEGQWIVAGRAPGKVTPEAELGSYGAIWNLVLFRIAAVTGPLIREMIFFFRGLPIAL